MKWITLFLFLFSFNTWACIGEVTYIDFHKAQSKIEVSGNGLVVRHVTALKFVTKMDIDIKPQESKPLSAPGGLILYNITSKSMSDLSGEVTATEMSEGKKQITIILTLKAPQKGNCSQTELKYY